MKLMIISGRSGSGKSVALHALEDLGYYCIDNLPLSLLTKLEDAIGNLHPYVAVSIDSRNVPEDLHHLKAIIHCLKQGITQCDIVYLDAEENALLKRYSETRRKHPLTSPTLSLQEAIQREHKLLAPIANMADFTLDTTDLSQHDLHQLIRDRAHILDADHLQLLILSFGFKFGLPPNADFVFDVRCLPNPYWKPELRHQTGLDADVAAFLGNQPDVMQMLQSITDFTKLWLPKFEADNRSYVTIAIGCTGGQHRSVFMVNHLVQSLQPLFRQVQARHRELPHLKKTAASDFASFAAK